ncbi:MAG: carboxypeptidase-like regulatory domain-containing protein [Bacteroidota bacterium]
MRNIYRFNLFLILLLCASFVYGQETSGSENQQIEITGEIIDAETNDPVPYVHVVNKKAALGTVSNTEGRFWITMDKSDTLLFSAIGFETFAFTLKDEVATDKMVVTIAMNMSTMELKPVKVFAFRDEAALKKALIDTKVPLESNQRGIQLPGFYYGPEKEVKPSAFGNPISFIASKFSKEIKEQKKLAQFNKDYEYQKLIKAKYNQQVIIEITGLPEDKVEEFMEYCHLEDSFLGPASEYEIVVAVNQCYSDFQKLEDDK